VAPGQDAVKQLLCHGDNLARPRGKPPSSVVDRRAIERFEA